MAIEIRPTVRRYRYLGIELPAPPGMSPDQVRDLHSTLYPELVNADIELGEIIGGTQEVTFKRAVGTKGAGLQRLRDMVASRMAASAHDDPIRSALDDEEAKQCSSMWERVAQRAVANRERRQVRAMPEAGQLPPVA